jgi:hypothetical protein
VSADAVVEDRCSHCSQRVVLVEYIGGVQWMHEPADVAGQVDAMHLYCLYCKLTVAESSVMNAPGSESV